MSDYRKGLLKPNKNKDLNMLIEMIDDKIGDIKVAKELACSVLKVFVARSVMMDELSKAVTEIARLKEGNDLL